MSAEIIDGAKIALYIRSDLKMKIKELKEKTAIVPTLVIIRVGDDSASISYISAKTKACEEVGIFSENIILPENITEVELISKIVELNKNTKVHGILIQMPLPKHINENKILNTLNPNKDVDGLHPLNLGKLLTGESELIACTPLAIQELLVKSGNNPEGKHIVICGRSNLVGKPLAALLSQNKENANATVTLVHSRTKNFAEITKLADILVATIGKPKFIRADMVKEGAVVIDVGINQIGTSPEGKRILVGDVDFEEVKKKAKAITPVPGGVGPMTVAMLLSNTYKAVNIHLPYKQL